LPVAATTWQQNCMLLKGLLLNELLLQQLQMQILHQLQRPVGQILLG
jgi:hypothetical protein